MHSERRRISQGSDFERLVGYSRAVVDGRWVFVAGTHTVFVEDVYQLVRAILQLGVGRSAEVTTGAVVDDGGLVGLVGSVRGEQIPHRGVVPPAPRPAHHRRSV